MFPDWLQERERVKKLFAEDLTLPLNSFEKFTGLKYDMTNYLSS